MGRQINTTRLVYTNKLSSRIFVTGLNTEHRIVSSIRWESQDGMLRPNGQQTNRYQQTGEHNENIFLNLCHSNTVQCVQTQNCVPNTLWISRRDAEAEWAADRSIPAPDWIRVRERRGKHCSSLIWVDVHFSVNMRQYGENNIYILKLVGSHIIWGKNTRWLQLCISRAVKMSKLVGGKKWKSMRSIYYKTYSKTYSKNGRTGMQLKC